MNKDDVMVEMILNSPHNNVMYFRRPDGSAYALKQPEKIVTELPSDWKSKFEK